MLARVRCLATGAAIGVGASAASSYLADNPLVMTQLKRKLSEAGGGSGSEKEEKPPLVCVVKMSGQIAAPAPGGLGARQTISLSAFEPVLEQAFKVEPRCVVLELNSPGGSPAQSSLLHSRLQQLRKKHPDVELLCYTTDVCASGGYYIASACDEIFVLPSSIVGSIGVVSPSVGLVELLRKWGVEDRTLTAGTSKAGDSPLRARDPAEVRKKEMLLEELHADFKAKVEAARGSRLKHYEASTYARAAGEVSRDQTRSDEIHRDQPRSGEVASSMRATASRAPERMSSLPERSQGWQRVDVESRLGDYKSRADRRTALFDGSVYGGARAVEFGLADGVYDDMHGHLKARFGETVCFAEVKGRQGLLEKLGAMQAAAAAQHATSLVTAATAASAELAEAPRVQ
mmetsp:Transcript_31272/g.98727  ORF Transcript_31272/g.98727 Transcript_31272/m.98727 type:complete len:402 (-) Transcript_31272:270-1475(-)